MQNNIRKIVSEEISKIVGEEFNYSAEEVEHTDRTELERTEASISTALSFMQDLQGSMNKLKSQFGLDTTTPEVDAHIEEAVSHINQAIDSYILTLSPEVRKQVSDRLGEIKIDK